MRFLITGNKIDIIVSIIWLIIILIYVASYTFQDIIERKFGKNCYNCKFYKLMTSNNKEEIYSCIKKHKINDISNIYCRYKCRICFKYKEFKAK